MANKVVALTIAGFDPSGGAGIIADIKTFIAFGWLPAAVITSLTFQNSRGVFGALHQTAELVRDQLLPIVEEVQVASLKIGMLPTREVVIKVAQLIRELNLPAPVVDPVCRSTSGYELVERDAIQALVSELMPLARLITPNIPEAERLTGITIDDEKQMRAAARKLREMGARAVLIKGGHLKQTSVSGNQEVSSSTLREGSRQAVDILDDEGRVTVVRGEWINYPPMRGTGCILSSAIAACLGNELSMEEAIRAAKEFVSDAIRKSASAS